MKSISKKNFCIIVYGDAKEILKNIEENSVDLIITSPPYADARKKHYDSILPDKYAEWLLAFNDGFKRVLINDGNFVLNIKDKIVNGVRHRFVWDTIIKLSQSGWNCIDDFIWHKTNPMPGYWPTRLRDGWEYCFHLAKEIKPYINQNAVKKPVGDWVKARLNNLSVQDIRRHNSSNESGFGRNISKWVDKKDVLPSNVISIALVGKNKGHPAVFPVDLPSFFIKMLSRENSIILDPFSGSGTTGVAALSLNRNCILIDNNLEYCHNSAIRINNEVNVDEYEIVLVDNLKDLAKFQKSQLKKILE